LSTYRGSNQTPIRGDDHLFRHLENHFSSSTEERLGLEYELLLVRRDNFQPPGYFGERGVESFLKRLASQGWLPILEGCHAVAAEAPFPQGGLLALEPGGQTELSLPPISDWGQMSALVHQWMEALTEEALALDLCLLPVGILPGEPDPEGWEDVPKARYSIMGPHMRRSGSLGRTMMKCTAGVQANVDVHSPEDFQARWKALWRLCPLILALSASSPREGWHSFRYKVWRNTDSDRCFFVPGALDPGFGMENWIHWAKKVPVMLRSVAKGWFAGSGRTFEEVMNSDTMTLGDWDLHLSTLFPEVRYKGWLEMRTPDNLPPLGAAALGVLVAAMTVEEGAQRWLEEHVSGEMDWFRLMAAAARGQLPASSRESLVLEGKNALRRLGGSPDWLEPLLPYARKTLAESIIEAGGLSEPKTIAKVLKNYGYPLPI